MQSDFAGAAATSYARFRRDLPAAQARLLADLLGLTPADTVIDLGCGTGQIGVPLTPLTRIVVGLDPEPAMVAGLRSRGSDVLPVLGDDGLLPRLGAMLGGVSAVVIGNAMHWMDEPVALARAVGVLRPGGGVAVINQGPPLWLGSDNWQLAVRRLMEHERGPLTASCGTDVATVAERGRIMTDLGLLIEVQRWTAAHPVDPPWVVGHLRSATGGRPLSDNAVAAIADAVPSDAIELVTTTVLAGVMIN